METLADFFGQLFVNYYNSIIAFLMITIAGAALICATASSFVIFREYKEAESPLVFWIALNSYAMLLIGMWAVFIGVIGFLVTVAHLFFATLSG